MKLKSYLSEVWRISAQYELIPYKGTEFQVKNLSDFIIKFHVSSEGKVDEAAITMPNGVFTAKKK